MRSIVFESYGIEVIKRGECLYVRYDAGEVVVRMVEVEVSEAEAAKVQLSEDDAYEVVLAIQGRKKIK